MAILIRFAPYLLVLFIAAGLMSAGWTARGWHEGSKYAVALVAAKAAADIEVKREANVAAVVENRLSELQANQTIIDRGIVREITKPVYRNVCLPDNAIRLLNAAARGAKPDSAESGEKVPDGAAAAN